MTSPDRLGAFAWQADKNGPWYFDWPRQTSSANHGWCEETLTNFRPPSPIAVLCIDCDWHAPTTTCLRALLPFVAEDGILIADGYPDWDGYARALHEYLAAYEGVAAIKQFQGLYYVVKGARKWLRFGRRDRLQFLIYTKAYVDVRH